MTLRFTSRSLAGTCRKLVAVGTARLASMFATTRAAAPRSGSPSGSLGVAVAPSVATGVTGVTGADGAGAAGAFVAGATVGSGSPSRR